MLLSCSAKKVTKEGGIGEVLRKCALPYVLHPPLRHPASKNVPIFERLLLKMLRFYPYRHPKIGTFSGVGWRCARRGFLRGHAFSECPLKSPSFGTFLGNQEKYIPHFLLQKCILFCMEGLIVAKDKVTKREQAKLSLSTIAIGCNL